VTPRVVLASSSPRRRELLRMIGIAHEVIPADIDETPGADEAPAALAERLAREKGAVVAARHPDAVVVAADTFVVIDDLVLNKPLDREEAARMLRRLAGRVHTVFTAVAAIRGGRVVCGVDEVMVTFADLSDDAIAAYIATGEPLDKAGAYGIQGYGATIVERIDGDYFAVMGLGLHRLVGLLARLGLAYDFRALRAVEPPHA
jgi:septum formation protein